jgi:integrase
MAKKLGNLDREDDIEQWDNPCEDFYDYKVNPPIDDKEGVGESRANQIRRAIIGIREDGTEINTDWDAWDQFYPDWESIGNPDTDGQFSTKHGIEYYNHLREYLRKSTVYENMLPVVQEFLDECLQRDIVGANPVAYILKEADPPDTDNNYPEITVAQWGHFFQSLGDPRRRAMYVTMAKTAIRLGELLNIDLPQLHLDHRIYRDYLDDLDTELVDEVADKPDSLYIPSEPVKGEEFRGEIREFGNKTSEGKLLPVDRELKRVLLDWIAMQGNVEHPYPLFSGNQSDRAGSPLNHLKQAMKDYGLKVEYVTPDEEDKEKKDMDIHYFRHFFSTNMQDSQGTYDRADWSWSRVKIIRGDLTDDSGGNNDSGSDGLQGIYTQGWGDLIREPYLRDIYNFGLYKPKRELST